jgi:hypothetical protein
VTLIARGVKKEGGENGAVFIFKMITALAVPHRHFVVEETLSE